MVFINFSPHTCKYIFFGHDISIISFNFTCSNINIVTASTDCAAWLSVQLFFHSINVRNDQVTFLNDESKTIYIPIEKRSIKYIFIPSVWREINVFVIHPRKKELEHTWTWFEKRYTEKKIDWRLLTVFDNKKKTNSFEHLTNFIQSSLESSRFRDSNSVSICV